MRRACILVSLLAAVLPLGGQKPGPAKATQPIFLDVTASSGVKFKSENIHTGQKYLIEPMGGGAAVLDYDGDGYLDLFFVNAAALEDPMPQGKSPDKSDPRRCASTLRPAQPRLAAAAGQVPGPADLNRPATGRNVAPARAQTMIAR